ncbi:hypothetical protein [Flindersiella endophytica]
MRERFTYEVAIWVDGCGGGGRGQWWVTLIREDTFSRDAGSIARSLLEQWIVGHRGQLRGGGRVFVYDGRAAARNRRAAPQHLAATVRVRVFSGSLALRDADPVAVAYLAEATPDNPVDLQDRLSA